MFTQSKSFSLPILFVLLHSFAAGAQPLVFEQGVDSYSGADDTTIFEENPDFSNGSSVNLFAGRTNNDEGTTFRRTLIRFDVSSIPGGSFVTAVEFRLSVAQSPGGGPNPTQQTLHPLLKDWNPGSVNGGARGAAAGQDDATWSSNLFGTETWAAGGGDFGPASATEEVAQSGTTATWTGAGLVADVQSWIDAPASNFGWILVGDETVLQTARSFRSSESFSGRPRLTVTLGSAPTSSVRNWELY